VVEYSDDFRIYLFTNLKQPHYSPEVLMKINLLNFNITKLALKDQMLSILAREEDPKLEEEKIGLM
jgi:dynein heavy chain, axonemal